MPTRCASLPNYSRYETICRAWQPPESDGFRRRAFKETLKALEIRARIQTQLETVEIERQRMLAERDERARQAAITEAQNSASQEARMIELETQRLEALARAAVALRALQETGVRIDIEVLMHRMVGSAAVHGVPRPNDVVSFGPPEDASPR
jgi:hypothetical protein